MMKNTIPNLLLVDDSSTNNLLLESALKSLNIKILTAISGEEAIAVMRKKEINLVLLDVMMPGMSGYDVLEEMRKDTNLASIPVIMVTARSKFDDGLKSQEVGVVDYYEKPLKLDVLIKRVKELLNLK